MKYFILFFLLLPAVSALAVTPTHLDCTENNQQQLLIINTLNITNFSITGAYSENFTLKNNESRMIVFTCNDIDYLKIEEIYTEYLSNSILIPIKINEKNEISLVIYIFLASTLGLSIYGWRKKRSKKFK